jgi:hypothetical protein
MAAIRAVSQFEVFTPHKAALSFAWTQKLGKNRAMKCTHFLRAGNCRYAWFAAVVGRSQTLEKGR